MQRGGAEYSGIQQNQKWAVSRSIPVFLGLGSNTGDCLGNLSDAIRRLRLSVGPAEAKSSVYQTAPWGDPDQPDYFNQVILIRTMLPPEQVLNLILAIEEAMGRRRHKANRNAPRVIDIDILYYGQELRQSDGLQVPHPRAHVRNFVLEPMKEIAPDWVDPVSGQTMTQLAIACEDALAVTRLDSERNLKG